MTTTDKIEAALRFYDQLPNSDTGYEQWYEDAGRIAREALTELEAVKGRFVLVPREPTASMVVAWNLAAKNSASYFLAEYYKAMIAAYEGERG